MRNLSKMTKVELWNEIGILEGRVAELESQIAETEETVFIQKDAGMTTWNDTKRIDKAVVST